MDPPPPGSEEFKGRLGIVNASFTWNLAKPKENEDQYLDNPQSSAPGSPSPGNVVTTESEIDISIDSSLLTDSTDHAFELRDISVIFPEGKLSVITGPTASGKTALLVRCHCFLSGNSVDRSSTEGITWRNDPTSWWASYHVEESL